MRAQLLLLNLICLTACETAQVNQAVSTTDAPELNIAATPTPTATPVPTATPNQCAIVGQYTNQSDAIQATITDSNGECLIALSCGLTAWLFDTAGNTWKLLVVAADGQTAGGCGLPNTFTNFNGKSGRYYDVSFGNYSGTWQGGFIPSQLNNVWSKI